eukprot:5136836-Prorocentrum_lima.AAC.1
MASHCVGLVPGCGRAGCCLHLALGFAQGFLGLIRGMAYGGRSLPFTRPKGSFLSRGVAAAASMW